MVPWLSSLLPTLVRRQRTATWSSFMVPVDCRSGSSLQCQTGTTPFQPGRTWLANGKGVLTANSHCPFLLISGALIKNERKHTHSLWEFSREEIYCFSPLQELFFFFFSSFGSHLCFCYYIILFFFNKKVRAGFEQKQIFLENGSYSFLTFVLKVRFGVDIKGPHWRVTQFG